MAENNRKFVVTTYNMYDITDGKNILLDATPADEPINLITGIGMIPLHTWEDKLCSLSAGDEYELALTADIAFGYYDEDAVFEIPREDLGVTGKLDENIFYPGAILPMRNEDGNIYHAKLLEINDKYLTMDFNHPLAGKDLLINGKIVESRPATDEDVMTLTAHHCGGCGGGGCHGDSCGDGGCGGCGNCHDGNEGDGNCCGGGCGHCAS